MTAYEKQLKTQQRLLVNRIVSGNLVNPSGVSHFVQTPSRYICFARNEFALALRGRIAILPLKIPHRAKLDFRKVRKSYPFEKGIAAYQDSYLSRLTGILQDGFPVSAALVGCAIFRQYAKKYLHFCKQNHYQINHSATGFCRFLKSIQFHKQSPILMDLLFFEKEMLELHYPKQRHHVLRYVQVDGRLLECRVLFSHYPVGKIWRSFMKKKGNLPSVLYREPFFIYIFYKIEERACFQLITQDEWIKICNYSDGCL